MQQNFWEQGNLTRVNFREHLNLFLGNREETPIFSREQGNMHPPWEALTEAVYRISRQGRRHAVMIRAATGDMLVQNGQSRRVILL